MSLWVVVRSLWSRCEVLVGRCEVVVGLCGLFRVLVTKHLTKRLFKWL